MQDHGLVQGARGPLAVGVRGPAPRAGPLSDEGGPRPDDRDIGAVGSLGGARTGALTCFGSLSASASCGHAAAHALVGSGPCVDGSGLARVFFTQAAVVGAAMCSALVRFRSVPRPPKS